MSIRITRPRFKRALNDARCELAEARARAARSLARLHEQDGTWLGWLAAEHYKVAQAKWREYLPAEGEERKVLRYEFLINLKSWLELLPMPVNSEADSYRKGSIFIAGFFGEDAFVISHARGGKRYRLLSDAMRTRRNDPYLRYPGSERFILPDGEDVGIMEVSDATRDRMVCLHDAFVLLAITRGNAFVFRFVGANDKYPVYPKALEKDVSSFVGKHELIERIKREISAYGSNKDETERVDEALCEPAATSLYKPKKAPETQSLIALNASILDAVDPTVEVPSLKSRARKGGVPDTVDVATDRLNKGQSKQDATSRVTLAPTPPPNKHTTGKALRSEGAEDDVAARSKHGTQRITSREVITNAFLKDDLLARQAEAAGLASNKSKKKGLTAFFEGILDDVDPLSVRPSLHRKQTGKTRELEEADILAAEFLPEASASARASGSEQTQSNRVISNFSRKVTTARIGASQTRRPSEEVTTELVRSKVSQRNNNERSSAMAKLQAELDQFFDPHDGSEVMIHTSLRSRQRTSEILRLKAFQGE